MAIDAKLAAKRALFYILAPLSRRVLRNEIAQQTRRIEELSAQLDERREPESVPPEPRLLLLDGIFPRDDLPEPIPEPFSRATFANRALQKLLSDYAFETVLDIGCGEGQQAAILLAHGKTVTAFDYGKSPYFAWRDPAIQTVIGDFNTYAFHEQYDCAWASHVLEHQPNPNLFLRKVHAVVKEGGIVAITVPPLKHQIVGGHLTLWNAGLLLYNLVFAGFDCAQASILQYGYNISVIVRKKTIDPAGLVYDMGDIRTIRPFLPAELPFVPNQFDDPFDGNIQRLNW